MHAEVNHSTPNRVNLHTGLCALILNYLLCAVLIGIWSICVTTAGAEHSEVPRPNIVVILADDLGYGDMRANNPERSRIPTPNMDRLAADGMRFTDGHSSSGVCSPSRYTLLTGRYHWRTRLQAGIVNVWGAPLIADDRVTIGTLAKQCGYTTACVGKWHLGRAWPISAEQQQYFQDFGGQPGGGGEVATTVTPAHREAWKAVFSQRIPAGPTERGFDAYFGTDVPNWPPYCFIEGDRTVGIPSELLPASKLVTNQASLQGPAVPDWQLEGILPALADRACQFIESQAKAGQPFLLYLPLTSPHTPLAVNESWRGKSGLNNAYADLVMQTDAVVGRVLDTLSAAGVEQNTLVLFTSDNGCAPYIGVAELQQQGHFPSGPFREFKGSFYEGGHRVPFLVGWPGVIQPGSVCHQLVHHADTLATLAEVLGVTLPDNAGEDSFSLVPLLQGQDRPIRSHAVSTSANGIPSLRDGDWKLILVEDSSLKTPVQLYNLADDPGETHNLALQHPDRVDSMLAELEALITRGRSTPGPNQKNDVRVKRYAEEDSDAPKS